MHSYKEKVNIYKRSWSHQIEEKNSGKFSKRVPRNMTVGE